MSQFLLLALIVIVCSRVPGIFSFVGELFLSFLGMVFDGEDAEEELGPYHELISGETTAYKEIGGIYEEK